MTSLDIQVIADYEEFLSLEPEWSELLKSSRSDLVFLTHEWFRCWWEAFGEPFDMFIVCVRESDRLVGIAPLGMTTKKFRGLPVRKLMFLANGYSAAADFIMVSEKDPVLQTIFEYLAGRMREWDMLDLYTIRPDSYLGQKISEVTRAFGMSSIIRPDIGMPYIPIEGGWRDFMSQRSPNFRKATRGRLNIIRKHADPVRVHKLTSPDEIAGVLAAVFDVSAMSWKAQTKHALTDEPSAMLFFERLSAVLGARGWIELWVVYCGERPVAFEYHLNYRGVTNPIRADFDESYRSLSPGAYLEHEILRTLFDDPGKSVHEYNTCADSYWYEMRWTDRIRQHSRVWIFTSSLYGKALYGLGLLRRRRKIVGRKEVMNSRSVVSRKSFTPNPDRP